MAKKDFEDITTTDCPLSCTLERCAITHAGICGHPKKGGLQSAFLSKPEVVARYNDARRALKQADE